MTVIQGSSGLTPRKEFEIQSLTTLRLRQFKNQYFRYPRVLCADVFSGSGSNEVGGEIIDGSPIRILNGYQAAKNFRRFCFLFSDVRKQACELLTALVASKFPKLNVPIGIEQLLASDAINLIGNIMDKNPDLFLYLVLDPNGPKDFPKREVEDLLAAFSKRTDVIAYISATTINRCIGARNKAGMDFGGWLGQIEDFDSGFVAAMTSGNRNGWIRMPIKGDRQKWTMLPTFGCMTPRNDWNKQGFVDLKSDEGRDAVKYYCGDIKNGN